MAFAPNTNKLYAPPLFASCLLVIDPANQTLDTSTICVATEFWSGGSWYVSVFMCCSRRTRPSPPLRFDTFVLIILGCFLLSFDS